MHPDAPDTALGYAFRRPELLRQALTHRSFAADHNERLEFIGDGVLNCAVALMLYDRFPHLPEGDLSRMRASLVNRDTLHRHAVALDLGTLLKLGEGEVKSGGAARPSILADALEAVLGAILLDGGFEAAHAAIERIYAADMAGAATEAIAKDPKTRLQEWLQRRRLPVPEYAIVAVHGEAHLQTFEVVCRIEALNIAAKGTGASRRAAEQAAAAQVYEQARRS
ncbi:MAG TPA: ribonuclease III [Casimicrobiaceae bacterium]|jgi:ribonuclease-3|nr:ribonuclease III [Casimicrobiaceae bacterium]